MTPTLTTGFLTGAEDRSISSALIAGAVIADVREDTGALRLYRVVDDAELAASTIAAIAELALSISPESAAEQAYLAIGGNEAGRTAVGASTSILRAAAKATEVPSQINVEWLGAGADHDELLHGCLEAFARICVRLGLSRLTAACTIVDQAPQALLDDPY